MNGLFESFYSFVAVVDYLKSHPDAQPFLQPVSEDIAPDYKEIIEVGIIIGGDTFRDVGVFLLEIIFFNIIDTDGFGNYRR